eukprot:7047096-Pyramimonas_sp.AAC.1
MLRLFALTGMRVLHSVYPNPRYQPTSSSIAPPFRGNVFLFGHSLKCEELSSESAVPEFRDFAGQARGSGNTY